MDSENFKCNICFVAQSAQNKVIENKDASGVIYLNAGVIFFDFDRLHIIHYPLKFSVTFSVQNMFVCDVMPSLCVNYG